MGMPVTARGLSLRIFCDFFFHLLRTLACIMCVLARWGSWPSSCPMPWRKTGFGLGYLKLGENVARFPRFFIFFIFFAFSGGRWRHDGLVAGVRALRGLGIGDGGPLGSKAVEGTSLEQAACRRGGQLKVEVERRNPSLFNVHEF